MRVLNPRTQTYWGTAAVGRNRLIRSEGHWKKLNYAAFGFVKRAVGSGLIGRGRPIHEPIPRQDEDGALSNAARLRSRTLRTCLRRRKECRDQFPKSACSHGTPSWTSVRCKFTDRCLDLPPVHHVCLRAFKFLLRQAVDKVVSKFMGLGEPNPSSDVMLRLYRRYSQQAAH